MSDARDVLVARLQGNLDTVRERIAAACADPGSVTIVAVTKTFGAEAVRAAADVGLRDVAENYTTELLETYKDTGPLGVRWHFLGALQRNKLSKLAPVVDVYQSVCSARDAAALSSRAPSARCYVEVNVSGAPGRAGCSPNETGAVVASARDAGLVVEGLMCVADQDPQLAAGQFAEVRRLADGCGLAGCSMGMSGDFELACARGATMVRLGTVLFGPRRGDRSGGLA